MSGSRLKLAFANTTHNHQPAQPAQPAQPVNMATERAASMVVKMVDTTETQLHLQSKENSEDVVNEFVDDIVEEILQDVVSIVTQVSPLAHGQPPTQSRYLQVLK